MLSACGCNWAGSETNICDKTGKCQCRANFQGEKCDKCKEGFAGDYCEKCDSKHQNSPYENGVCLRKIYILFHLINLVTNIICFISACLCRSVAAFGLDSIAPCGLQRIIRFASFD